MNHPTSFNIHIYQTDEELLMSGSAPVHDGSFPARWQERLRKDILSIGFQVVHQRHFQSAAVQGQIVRAVRHPVTQQVTADGVHQNFWTDGDRRHLIVSNLWSADAQTVIFRAHELLQQHGFAMRDVARTWYYIHHILDGYDSFNQQRIAAYRELGIDNDGATLKQQLPASTGVGIQAPQTPYQLELYAVQQAPITPLYNPAQKEAYLYGSAFGRGVIIGTAAGTPTMIQLSGTAAIDEAGNSLFPGDFTAQVRTTFEKIDALLVTASCTIHQLAAGCAFIKEPSYLPLYFEYLRQHQLSQLPLVPVIADICRDELLFEIDGEFIF